MKRVTGIGGIFFEAQNPEKLRCSCETHLGMPIESWGGHPFHLREDTRYFDPSEKPFMINYRVEDLYEVLAALKSEGVNVDEKIEESEYGRFGWVMDPEGNRTDLWEPPDNE